MPQQRTLKERVEITGVDLPSGRPSRMYIGRAPKNTGIVFQTPNEQICASLGNAFSRKIGVAKTLVLEGKYERVGTPEHVVAQLYVYGIDNAIVEISNPPTILSHLSQATGLGSARNTYFVPYFGRKLCEALDDNSEEQDEPRRVIRLEDEINSENGKLIITSIESDDVKVIVYTDYKLGGGERIRQSEELTISPESMREISIARNYCGVHFIIPRWLTKTVARFFLLSHGFGNGNDPSNLFYPTRTETQWHAQELMENELAKHTIMDRLGELVLLGRVKGVCIECNKAGHKDSINILKQNRDKFKVVED